MAYKSFLSFLLSLITIFLLTGSICLAQKTDIVILNNGDHITGEISSLRVGILTFKTDDMETLNIQWDKIKTISTVNFYEVELNDGRVYYGAVQPSENDGRLLIKGNDPEPELFMKYIVRMVRIQESFWDILDGYVKFGFSFTKASDVGQLSLGSNAKYRTKEYLSEVTLNTVITTTSAEATSRKQDLGLTYQHNLEDTWFSAGIITVESNTELGIKLRASLGAGIGNNFIQSDDEWMYALAGLVVNRELKEDQSEAVHNIEILLNAQYQLFKYDHPKANLLTYVFVYPSVTDFGRFRVNYNAELSWEIFIDFFWDLAFYFEYDTESISESASQIDYRIDTTIKYEF